MLDPRIDLRSLEAFYWAVKLNQLHPRRTEHLSVCRHSPGVGHLDALAQMGEAVAAEHRAAA